jgi:periplasmic divalent cation tolerance protein
VNRLPGVASTYRWRGEIHEDAEVLLVIKTTRERFDALRERLVELHPYELPELVAIEIAEGLPAYLDWLARETTAP